MHMDDAGVGRAIYPDAASSSQAPTFFAAKEEPLRGPLARELAALGIKDLRIASSGGEKMLYSRDQSEIPKFLKDVMFNSIPDVVAQPQAPQAVASVLRFASLKRVAAIPRGSASSPFGGSVPVAGGIVVDVSGMDKILQVDSGKGTIRVQAGARWADLDNELEKIGMALMSTPSSKFSTVGGWVATGGIGLNSFSTGHLSKSVHSLEIVTSDGSIRELTRM